MAQPTKGIDKIWLMRELSKEKEEHATKLMFQTESEKKIKVDSETEPTKDGPVQSAGTVEYDISVTMFASREDPWYDKLEDITTNGVDLGFWEIDRNAKESDGKYPGRYYEGIISEYSEKTESEGFLEIELTLGIRGIGQKGMCTLSKEQQEAAQYAFKDTTPVQESRTKK